MPPHGYIDLMLGAILAFWFMGIGFILGLKYARCHKPKKLIAKLTVLGSQPKDTGR